VKLKRNLLLLVVAALLMTLAPPVKLPIKSPISLISPLLITLAHKPRKVLLKKISLASAISEVSKVKLLNTKNLLKYLNLNNLNKITSVSRILKHSSLILS